MIKQLKAITVNMIAGANVATVIIMLFVGYADYISPAKHPFVANFGLLLPVFLLANLLFLFFWLIFKRRMSLIPIIGYVLCYGPIRTYLPLNLPVDMPQNTLKVLSYNVQSFTGEPLYSYEEATQDIVDYIRQSKADIVCLQEAIPATNALQRLDSIYAYRDTTIIGYKGINAVGICSHYPIVKKEVITYHSRGNGSVAYFLKINADTVIVINNHLESNHLSLNDRQDYKDMILGEAEKDSMRSTSRKLIYKLADAVAIRYKQADAVRQYILSHQQYPMIVCGDFNDNPISYTRKTIAQDLIDCYVTTGSGVGHSYNQKGFYVRIDNMMCSADFEPYNCTIDGNIDASDHYPIYCWFKMHTKHEKMKEKQ